MSMIDPIADMLTQIRNAQMVFKQSITISMSKLNMAIAKVLLDEGYIASVEEIKDEKPMMTIALKYHNNKGVIELLQRVSKASLRHYVASKDIPSVRGGLGIVIISTSKGVMSGGAAKSLNLGGEILCRVY